MPTAVLDDRGVVSVAGADAEKLLQGLITNDIRLAREGRAIHAGLLSPQGKILFEFLIAPKDGALLLDVARDKAAELTKRLTMYRLRAEAEIADRSAEYRVLARWGEPTSRDAAARMSLEFADPRSVTLGSRIITTLGDDTVGSVSREHYDALRIAAGVAEGGKDYAFGDAYPHEANFDIQSGASFSKGCYVGQEVVARMQNKTVVRKRIVRLTGAEALTSGADVTTRDVAIGKVGSTSGRQSLAMLRLDRVLEALDRGSGLTSGGVCVEADPQAIALYRASIAALPASAAPLP